MSTAARRTGWVLAAAGTVVIAGTVVAAHGNDDAAGRLANAGYTDVGRVGDAHVFAREHYDQHRLRIGVRLTGPLASLCTGDGPAAQTRVPLCSGSDPDVGTVVVYAVARGRGAVTATLDDGSRHALAVVATPHGWRIDLAVLLLPGVARDVAALQIAPPTAQR